MDKKKKHRNAPAVPLKETIEALASNSLRAMTPVNKTTLKKMCPTRWSSRHDAVVSLRHNYKDILKSLTEISLTSTKADERTEASGLLKVIQTFEFIMLVVMQDKLLLSVNLLSQLLQRQDMTWICLMLRQC